MLNELGALGERAYYLHVHKAAGITVRRALSAMVPADVVCPVEEYRDWELMTDPSHFRLFCGHLGLRPIEAFPGITLLTTVREPVERALSHYHQIRRFTRHPIHRVANEEAPTFSSFLRHPLGREALTDRQARMLVGSAGSEPLPPVGMPADELRDRALARLDECAWVGTVARLDESIVMLAELVGQRAPRHLEAANRAPTPADSRELDGETIARAAEMTQVDAVVYEHAERRVERDLAAMIGRRRDDEYRAVLTRSSTPLEQELVVDIGAAASSGGWVDRGQVEGVGVVRWLGADEPAWLDVPRSIPLGATVSLRFVGDLPRGEHEVMVWLDDERITTRLRDDSNQMWCEGVTNVEHGPLTRVRVACAAPGRAVAEIRLVRGVERTSV